MKGFGWPVFRFPPFIFFSAGDFLVFFDSCTVYIVTIWNISPQISSFPSISPLLPGHFSILRPCTGNYGGKINVKVVLPRRLFSVLLMAKRDICASSENIPPLSRWKAFEKNSDPGGHQQEVSRTCRAHELFSLIEANLTKEGKKKTVTLSSKSEDKVSQLL